MWRGDLVIEETRREPPEGSSERMLRKAAAMLVAYALAGAVLGYACAQFGMGSRYWRGMAVIAALWAGHLDAASWVHSVGADSTPLGRLLSRGADLARRRRSLVWLLCLSPLASGLLAMQWSRLDLGEALAQALHAGLLWPFGMGLASVAASILSPSKLAAIEKASPSKSGRVGKAAALTWIDLCSCLGSWFFFCKVAGWL